MNNISIFQKHDSTKSPSISSKPISRNICLIFEIKSTNKVKILGGKELIKEGILISQKKDEVQIMDSKTYKTYEIKKPKNINLDVKTLKLIKINDQVFLFPI